MKKSVELPMINNHLSDILLPYLTEEFNPKTIYAFSHPSFEGDGYKAFQTLLIVLGEERQKSFCKLRARAEELGLEGYGYLLCFRKWSALSTALSRRHLFSSLVCQRKNLIYSKGREKLTIASSDRLWPVIVKAEIDFATCMTRISAFLEGARFYEERDDLPMAAFMLQQSVELLFRAAELALKGQEKRCHLIRRHVGLCKPMLPRTCAAFPLITEADGALLQLLNDAYLNVRYRDQYVISKKDFRKAFVRASRMMSIAPREVAAMTQLAKKVAKERNHVIPANYDDTNQ